MDDDSSAPMVPKACNPVLVVAHTPGIPAWYEVLLKNISFLLSWENQGKSYQCSLNQKNLFLSWSKAEKCLFFEWEEKDERMVCWMHDIPGNSHMKFLVNPAIRHAVNDVTVKHPALAFSMGFADEPWASVKEMLTTIFGSSEKKDSVEHDHLYVFTRIDSFFCIRNYKIDAFPEVDNHGSPLVLTEVNPFCCFKLLDAQGIINQVPDMSESQLFRTVFYSVKSDCPGSYTPHSLKLNNEIYQILLKDDCNQSVVAEYDGFNLSLDHLLSKEPSLKNKHIIGSRTNKQSVFVRNRFKFIFRSTVRQLQDLFAANKCLELERKIGFQRSNVLIRGTDVKFYGLKVIKYTNEVARMNILSLANLIRSCFSRSLIPVEARDALDRLCKSEKDPLNSLEELNADCLWLRAEERRALLITHHSEYMTNFDIKEEVAYDIKDEPDAGRETIFYENCPYIDSWKQAATDNEYLMEVSHLPKDEIKGDMLKDPVEVSVEGATEGRLKDAVKERTKKKVNMNNRSREVKKRQRRRRRIRSKGKIQFNSMRNFGMHMPEKAKKDGIHPFRLGIADYILTAYYPKYLAFVHGKLSSLLREQKLKKKASKRL